MFRSEIIVERKSTLFSIVVAGVIAILAMPIIIPNLLHGACLRNQHLDSKILSIPSRVLASKIPILLGFLFVMLFVPQLAFADVYIPLHEYLGYFDSNGIYTVVGNVKNTNDFGSPYNYCFCN